MFVYQILCENLPLFEDLVKIILSYNASAIGAWIRLPKSKKSDKEKEMKEFSTDPKYWQRELVPPSAAASMSKYKSSFTLVESTPKSNKRKLNQPSKKLYSENCIEIVLPIASMIDGDECVWYVDDSSSPVMMYNINAITIEHLNLVRKQYCGEKFKKDDPSPEAEDEYEIENLDYDLRFSCTPNNNFFLNPAGKNTTDITNSTSTSNTLPTSTISTSSSSAINISSSSSNTKIAEQDLNIAATTSKLSTSSFSSLSSTSPTLSLSSISPTLSSSISPTLSSSSTSSPSLSTSSPSSSTSPSSYVSSLSSQPRSAAVNESATHGKINLGLINEFAAYYFDDRCECIIFYKRKNYGDDRKEHIKRRQSDRFMSHYYPEKFCQLKD